MIAAAVAKIMVFCAGLLRSEAAHSSRSKRSGRVMPKSSRSDRRVHSLLGGVVGMGLSYAPAGACVYSPVTPRVWARGYYLVPLPGLRVRDGRTYGTVC